MTDDTMRDRAQALGELIAKEDGTANACDDIDTFLAA